MILLISEFAEQDIEEIALYIAKDNPVRAKSFTDELYLQCRQISEAPLIYQQRADAGEGIRSCAYGRYIIFFSYKENFVKIERVLHGARKITTVFN